ncbi:MAG: hypothetical protein QW320_06625 [Ignisphaera sp.]|uniref:hypothetical protein n=1 Tax=Thermofilum sp. TaxID=1961369 RepID=UPI0031620572
MTGPAYGKIRLDASLLLYDSLDEDSGDLVSCIVYVHVKGYAGASVTHLDLEGGECYGAVSRAFGLDEAGYRYVDLISEGDFLIARHKSLGKMLSIMTSESLFGSHSCRGVIGVKEEGVYIGLCRAMIDEVESWAESKL